MSYRIWSILFMYADFIIVTKLPQTNLNILYRERKKIGIT